MTHISTVEEGAELAPGNAAPDQGRLAPRSGGQADLTSDVALSWPGVCWQVRDRHTALPASEQLHPASGTISAGRIPDVSQPRLRLETFARENPVIFMGCLALAGFGTIRLLSAGRRGRAGRSATTPAPRTTMFAGYRPYP